MDDIDFAKQMGFVMHPLIKKIPIIPGWQNMTESYPRIDEHFANGGNVGLVCGKASNVTVIDMDSFLFADDIFGKGINTLKSSRTEGRGHIYFKYNPNLKPAKRHYLGIEIIGDGGNIVLPPSLHYNKDGTLSGDKYAWKQSDIPISYMTEDIEHNIITLFKTETELKQYLSKCRTCIRDILQRNHEGKLLSMHGSIGREYMLSICTDLKNAGAQQEHILVFAKLLYKETFDAARTLQEWYRINASMTWTCEKMREKVTEYLDAQQCAQCQARKDLYNKKDICISDMMRGDKCSSCPYHPSNNPIQPNNINKGVQNMIEQKKQSAFSLANVRSEFMYKLKNIVISPGKFTIVEDFSYGSTLRTITKTSKSGFPYNLGVIKVEVDGFVADMEIHKDEVITIFRELPADLPTYKGYTLVLEGDKWTAYKPNTAPIVAAPPISQPIPPQNQVDKFANQLRGTVELNDVDGKGLSTKTMIVYAEMIQPGDAIGLITYTKSKGLILEQNGMYRAV